MEEEERREEERRNKDLSSVLLYVDELCEQLDDKI